MIFSEHVAGPCSHLAGHHDPTGWLTDDGLGGTTPHNLGEAGTAIAPHDQKVDRMGAHIGFEDLSDRTAADLHGFEAGLDPVLGEMSNEVRAGSHLVRSMFVGCRDDADGLGGL